MVVLLPLIYIASVLRLWSAGNVVSGTSFGFPDFASDFPVLFVGLSRFCIGLSRFSSALSQRPPGGGRATIGRWSRGHRAVVAGNVLGKIEYRADGFHRHRE